MSRVTAFVPCECVADGWDNRHLIGVFPTLRSPRFPFRVRSFELYLRIVEIRREEPLFIRAEIRNSAVPADDSVGALLWFDQWRPEPGSWSTEQEATLIVDSVTFPRAGDYEIRIIIDGKLAEVASLRVRDTP